MSKRHKPEEVIAKLRQVDVLTSQGTTVADAVRAIGVTEVTYYRWRQEYGGLKTNQVRRMKELELENQRLRKAVADLTLDKQILAEAARGNCLEPRAPACLCRAHQSQAEHLRTPRLPRARSASLDTAQGAAGQRRRGGAHGRHHCARTRVWALWLSQDHSPASGSGLGGERQAGGADLEAGGAEGASQAAEEGAALAGRWVLCPAQAGASEPCLVL